MSHNLARRTSTEDQKRKRFLKQLWNLFTGTQSGPRLRSQVLGFVESLEERRLLAYTTTLVGSTADFVGDGGADTLTFDQSGGLLRHNRFTAGDAGYNSNLDFDTTVAGDQTLVVNAASEININSGLGSDIVNIGTAAVPASDLLAKFNYQSGGSGDMLMVDDSARGAFNAYTSNTFNITATGINVIVGTTVTGGRNLVTGSGDDTVLVQATFTGEAQSFDSSGGSDTVTVGTPGSGTANIAAAVNIANTPSLSKIIIDNAVDATNRTVSVSSTSVTGLSAGNINFVAADVESLSITTGTNADVVNINSTPAITNIVTGAGNDSIVFANGASLNGGTVDGGADTDTLDYSAYTTGVSANLGLNVSGLSATLSGDQEVPANNSTASGTASVTNYNPLTRTFDISVTVNDVAPATVTGFHIHRGVFGVNGPVIVNFGTGSLVPAGTGFTFNAVGLSLNAANFQDEAALLSGSTYVNVHTAAFPGGIIRGQLFSNGNVALASGRATGTGGVTGIENAIGGSAADGLVGTTVVNSLQGNAGNDVLLGGPGNDNMQGGNDSDVLVWSNGDNTDVIDGNAGTDIVSVNGAVATGDIFTVAGAAGRVAFARTNLVPFALDIGTVEQLIVNGVGGDDSLTSSNMSGVVDLTTLDLNGQAGNDTFNATFPTPATLTVNVKGGPHGAGDALNVDAGGGQITDNGTQLSKPGFSPINYAQIENLSIANIGDLTITGSGIDDNLVVNATSANAGTYKLNGGPVIVFTGMTKLTFNSAAGSDGLTINNPAGGLFAPVGGIDYNGGGQAGDLLNLLGGGAADLVQTYFVGTTTPPIGVGPGNSGDGLLRFTGSSNVDIRFTGLAPIVDTVVAASLTVNSTDAANSISVTNGAAPRLIVAVDAFETIEFNNKAQLIVNGGDGAAGGDAADTILLNFSNLPSGLTGVRVNADEGADAVSLQASSNVPVTLHSGDGLDTINVGNNGTLGTPGLLTPVAGPVIVNGGAGGANLTVDGTGAAVAADYAITATTVTRSLPAGFGGVTYSNLATLLLATGSGPNVVTVSSTSVPTTADANAGIDTLILNPTNAITVYEQAGNYSFDLGTPGGLTALDFENINLFPGNGVLNVVGDEGQGTNLGGVGVDDTDRVEVVGTEQNAGGLRLNNIALPQIVMFAGVTKLNISTFDLDDDITLDPFASTTQAWNIVVNVNSGAGDDDIFYGNASVLPVVDPIPNGSAPAVSENVTVTPTLFPGTGEIAVPGVVTIHFQETEDLSFLLNNGVLGDSDTLTIRGTDNNLSDTFTIRPDAAGIDGDPLVDLDVSAAQNLQIENIALIAPGGAQFFVTAINFEGLGGSDTFDLVPAVAGTILNIDGGNPTNNPLASDVIVISGTVGVADLFTVTPGATADAGAIASTINGTPRAAVSFKNVEGVNLDLGGGAAADVLTMQGTGANNAFTLEATGVASGTVRVDARPLVTFTGFGTSGSDINLVGLGGDDQFSVTHLANWVVDDVNIDGGAPSASDAFQLSGTVGVDSFAYTASSANSGQIDLTSGGLTTNYILTSVESALLQGGIDDNLTINGTALNDTTILNPTGIGTGSFASGASPQFTFQSFDHVTVNPGAGGFDRVQINGTEGVDTVTSNANTVTLGGTVTIGAGIDQLDINTFGGNDNVDLDLAVNGLAKFINVGAGNDAVNLQGVALDPADPTIYGGDGDDFIIGSPNPDSIFGGTGNDILVGGAGVDQIYGEEGNDILGNPSAIANGLADDAGNDFFNGGAGSDLVIWEPGDGSDIVEGGAGDADVLAFFGSAGAEVFNVFAKLSDPSRTILFRNLGNITIDMAGVDQINVQGNAGADAYVVGRANNGDSGNVVAPTSPYVDPTASLSDLSTTEIRVVNIIEATDAPDNVFVDGRPTNDNLTVTVESALTGVVRIAGLPYDVRVSGTTTADRLTIRGNEGHDTIKAINSSSATVEGLIGITLAGGVGNDTLSADAILIGGSGDDFLEGGAGADQLFGNDGEDTMIGGAGLDTFDGGAGFDTLLVRGTLGNDAIDISQTADVTLVQTVNGVVETDTLVLNAGTRTVERVSIEASAGNDTIRVQWADSLGTDANVNGLRVDVDGGAGTTADRLGVVDLGTGDLILFEHGTTDDSGAMAIGPGNTEPLIVNFTNIEVAQPVAGADGDVVFFKHDDFEYNDARTLATYLGSGDAINVDPNINPGLDPIFGLPSDEDWFRVVAERTGVLDFQVYFRQVGPVASGRPGLPNNGNLDIAVTDAAGNVIAGFGANDATSDERVRIPAVAGQTYYLRVFANGAAINTYNVTVDNYAPPVPRDIELLDNPVGDPPPANSDTGRSQFDNVTRDNTPTLVFRLDDGILLNDIQGNSPAGNNPPNGVVIPIPFQAAAGTAGYRIAIFDEGSSPAPGTQVGTAPQVPLGFATFVSPGVYQFTTPVLNDGSHFLTARVQIVDPAVAQQTGFGERSVALEIVVDTVVPPGFFGQINLADTTQGLAAESDSGVVGDSATFVDRVTNDTTPSFYGRAEADAIVRVYAETNGVAGLQSTGAAPDLFLGLTVATPLDGTNQFPGGQWSFTTPLDLNNPNLGFAEDGARSLYTTAEDLAGNTTPDGAADRLNIFLDTAGPQVTNVEITGTPAFNLFGLKPDNAVEGPTPRVDGLTIRVRDLPNRSNLDPNFLYGPLQQTVAVAPGNYVLQGDHSGIIAIRSIVFIPVAPANGAIATGRIELEFFAPLPDDRYTLTIKDNVVDPVGNKLDGESNAAEPIGNPAFPSGDGQPGRDFLARFTVDSRPEIGAISEGIVYVDINGNMVWDPEGQDNDATNRDFTFQFGQLVDAHFAGNFAPVGAVAASGYDKLGAYGKFGGLYSFILDTNDDGVGDFSSLMPAAYQVNGIPVAGDFNAAHPGDEIGLFDGSFWYLDINGNNQIDLGERIASNFNGLPLVGDFNGDGNDDLAVFVNDTNRFIFDTNRDGIANFTWNVADQLGRFGGLSGFTDRPVAGDLNLDGIDDIGLWAKDRQGTLPRNSGEYFFWVSDRVNANPANVFDSFSPAPLGNDLSAEFGDELALPIFGNFDPPVTKSTDDTNPLHREPAPLDISGDGVISPLDALLVINVLNKFRGLPTNDPVRAYFTIGQVKADSSGDRAVTPLDALLVINSLNRRGTGGEGETSSVSADSVEYQTGADSFFAQLGDDSDFENLKKRRR